MGRRHHCILGPLRVCLLTCAPGDLAPLISSGGICRNRICSVTGRTVIIASDAGLSPPAAGVDVLPNKPMTRSFWVVSALLLCAAAFGGRRPQSDRTP
jgi:hypothetical protein